MNTLWVLVSYIGADISLSVSFDVKVNTLRVLVSYIGFLYLHLWRFKVNTLWLLVSYIGADIR